MQFSEKFSKLADKIVKRDKAVFDELEQFERTKQIRTKEKLNFTIDKVVASRFRKVCRQKGYNMSAKIENAMRAIVEEIS